MGFVLNTTYYTGNVYEWNLPSGYTCPFAKECKVYVDRISGKFLIPKGKFKCYAAYAERYPAVRKSRWENLKLIKSGGKPQLPTDCENVRIHASGDFFTPEYLNLWIEIAKENPKINFWGFTKSIKYWLIVRDQIPSNLILTASYGGLDDELIEKNKLKHAKVYLKLSEVRENQKYVLRFLIIRNILMMI